MDLLEVALIKDTLCDDFEFDWETVERMLKAMDLDVMMEDSNRNDFPSEQNKAMPSYADLDLEDNGVVDVVYTFPLDSSDICRTGKETDKGGPFPFEGLSAGHNSGT
ncbi:hypothetical protein LOK49_LG13G00886 [Camellia lanceoleosa]|uniref:Uncharacterized protein n=1 Tax=Camellia lanceoleosa TaxID=1840588 RepID=A0ACC0FG57_9ERIC|nr:hypothetical protein LOK49_LG13G00886 [Camellia lanceoleosa]